MAITSPGSASSAVNSVAASSIDLTHTVASGTELLILVAAIRSAQTVSSIEDWNTTESFTQIAELTIVTPADEQYFAVYGLINPTAMADTITVSFSGSSGWQYAYAVNYAGNNTDSIAAATNNLEEVKNTSAGTTTTFASAGTAGNALVIIGQGNGDDMDPVSNDQTWDEIIEVGTGGGGTGNADAVAYLAHLLEASGAVAPEITWNNSDTNTGLYLEIVAAAGSVYINDATTLDGGEVLQTYPGASNWADGQITMTTAPDTTGLTPPLYCLVQTATGAVAYRAITVADAGVTLTDVINVTDGSPIV